MFETELNGRDWIEFGSVKIFFVDFQIFHLPFWFILKKITFYRWMAIIIIVIIDCGSISRTKPILSTTGQGVNIWLTFSLLIFFIFTFFWTVIFNFWFVDEADIQQERKTSNLWWTHRDKLISFIFQSLW